jgi:flavin-binding protein dodecin
VRELPFGGYATIERGITFADGTFERVQLGHFRVESISWHELEGSATLTLADRMAQVQDEAFLAPWVPEGMHPSDAIVAAVHEVFGDAIAYHVSTNPGSESTLTGTVYDESRSQAISDLASSIAAETLFDNLGDFVLRPRDRPAEVVWSVDAGARGALITAEETLDRSSVRNGVSVRGQPTPEEPPIYGLATHDDPTSPTRWGGPFGKVPLISSSTAVADQAQADAAARALLNLRLGLARTLVLQSIPNPALEPDDLIEVVFADGRTETQTVNRIEIGLGVDGALSITTTSLYRPEFEPVLALPHADTGWAAVE